MYETFDSMKERKKVNLYSIFFHFEEKVPPWAPNKLLHFLWLVLDYIKLELSEIY